MVLSAIDSIGVVRECMKTDDAVPDWSGTACGRRAGGDGEDGIASFDAAAMTLNVYGRANIDRMTAAAEAVGGMLTVDENAQKTPKKGGGA